MPAVAYEETSLWTPDGSSVIFSHAGRIYVVDADGTELTSLSGSYEPVDRYSETIEIDFFPTLSPDGSRAAYSTYGYARTGARENESEIAVQSIDGSERVRLTENDRDDIAPSWSPDGSRIAFMSPKTLWEFAYWEGYRVFIMSSDGSGEREIAPSLAPLCCALAWSPDGSRLAFLSERRETEAVEWKEKPYDGPVERGVIRDYWVRRQSVYTVKADGSGLVELAWSENPDSAPKTRAGRNDWSPEEQASMFRWSPDGERLAFAARYYGEKDGIYVADADGASVRRIFDLAAVSNHPSAEFEGITEIAWSPDGSRIDFEASVVRGDTYTPAAYSVFADGADLRQLAEGRLELSERIRTGSGPKRIVRYGQSQNAELGMLTVATATRNWRSWADGTVGWILSTAPWGGSEETVLARIVNNRVAAANPPIPEVADAGAECGKAVSGERRANELMEDCRTLLEIRDALAGGAVLYWTGDRPISEWGGITVEDGRVRALETVPGVQLAGTMPPKIAELTGLRTLNLASNELVGEIPRELGDLSNLRILNLSYNNLEGEIPPELGDLASLEELRLHSNPLHGGIPTELGKLRNLRVLHLGGYGSRLNAAIPPELGKLENLEGLSLAWAPLTGGIPPELGNLSNLRVLDLRGNAGAGLAGAIPRELANLKNLNTLYLSGNQLEGRVPPEFGDLITKVDVGYHMRLGSVDFRDNRLTGCVPPKLEHVHHFYADIPFCE